jgi:hypothetical protein
MEEVAAGAAVLGVADGVAAPGAAAAGTGRISEQTTDRAPVLAARPWPELRLTRSARTADPGHKRMRRATRRKCKRSGSIGTPCNHRSNRQKSEHRGRTLR